VCKYIAKGICLVDVEVNCGFLIQHRASTFRGEYSDVIVQGTTTTTGRGWMREPEIVRFSKSGEIGASFDPTYRLAK
jgi:hypothetical protein